MTYMQRFWIGGGGSLLPLLVTLLAVDVSGIIDHGSSISLGVYIGTALRYVILFILGGAVAMLNSDESRPLKLVQFGIGAPAIITSLVNANAPAALNPSAHATANITFIETAYAGETSGREDINGVRLADSFLSDIVSGITRSVPNAASHSGSSGSANFQIANPPARPENSLRIYTSPVVFHVPQASCNPRCSPGGGDEHTFQSQLPANLLFVGSTAHVACNGEGCVFDTKSAEIDNNGHVATLKIKSRSGPVDIQLQAVAYPQRGTGAQ